MLKIIITILMVFALGLCITNIVLSGIFAFLKKKKFKINWLKIIRIIKIEYAITIIFVISFGVISVVFKTRTIVDILLFEISALLILYSSYDLIVYK